MIKNIDVIFWVEHKDRELECYKVIAQKLKNKYGLTSLIISNFFHSHYLWLYKAKVYIFNNLNNNIGWPDGFIWSTYRDSVVYISHRWEQNLFPINFEFKAPYNEFEKQKVKLFAWDEYFKEYLINYGVSANNISIVGNIASDILYKLQNNSYNLRYKLSKEFSLNITKQWLFLPMNFNWAFMDETTIINKIKNGYNEKVAHEYNEYSKKCLKEFIIFIEKVNKQHNFEIILRPHPSITPKNYINTFNNILGYIPSNILINKSYSVREWIIASDVIGSNWSTSVWDAYQIGKKSFYFSPYERPNWLNTYWLDSVDNIQNIKEFNEFHNQDRIANSDYLDTSMNSIDKFAYEIYSILPNNYPKIKLINIFYIKYLFKYYIKNTLCKYFRCKFIQEWQTYDWFDAIKIRKIK
jgi:surface carbohydrate biosynthesis protein